MTTLTPTLGTTVSPDASSARPAPQRLGRAERRRLGIKSKVFLLLLVQSLVVMVVFSVLVDWAFNDGFARYSNQFNDHPARVFVRLLELEYERSNGWQWLTNHPERWAELAMTAAGHPVRNLEELRALFEEFKVNDFPDTLGAPLPLRFLLLGPRREVLIGTLQRTAAYREWPLHRGGELVGYLAVPQNRPTPYDLQFKERFLTGLGITLLGSVLLAVLPALFIARRVTRPVRAIGRAAQMLASGSTIAPLRIESRDELGDLARDFNELSIALARNQYLQHQWLAEIAHELRTPIANLMAEAEAVVDGLRPATTHRFRSLYEECGRLSRLIDDLHQLSSLDGGMVKLHPAVVRLGEVLRSCMGALQTRFDLRGIQLTCSLASEDPNLIADPDKLRQVFMNLLENSLRYKDRGGQVRIEAIREGAHIVVRYDDSAPGVSEEELAHLFNRLYRGEASRSRASGGAGLGLAIVQSIVQAHGGTISAMHSRLGGLRFEMVFNAVD